MFEGIYRRLAHHSDVVRILCGDFNAPQDETADGRVITWAETVAPDGSVVLLPKYRRSDAGERSILEGLAPFGMYHVFRGLNGYQVKAFSWVHRTKYGVTQRRFDHIFAPHSLNATRCEYLIGLVEAGLSDHAAIEACFQPEVPNRLTPE